MASTRRRLGRLLIPLILVEAGILNEPLLYLSVFFKKHRQVYYERLQQVRVTGDTRRIDPSIYREGRLPPEHLALAQLFKDEPESTKLVWVVVRPAVYLALQEHGQKKQALFPDVITPLVYGVWVMRKGWFTPAEPPVFPRDLLRPQADDRFLTKAEPRVWSGRGFRSRALRSARSERDSRGLMSEMGSRGRAGIQSHIPEIMKSTAAMIFSR
ncbi:hypothetical protein [Halomonas heilongjiangensis]|uniref:hypothetical protein n=1 Tax=Halomonas heilongjiangensis TaxID=1387883 RepID=UPI00197AF272|nr:hypothetical protein [Halomonas heilongjiangensis]